MKNIHKHLATLLITVFSLTILLSFGSIVFATTAMEGLNETANVAVIPKTSDTDIPKKIGEIVGSLLAFIGVLFMGLIIYGGFIWMTARGNESEAKKAKDIIVDAVIGLIIVFSAYAITSFIGQSLGQ